MGYVDVAGVQETFYKDNTLYDLFTNVAGDTIFKFWKETDLYTYATINKNYLSSWWNITKTG